MKIVERRYDGSYDLFKNFSSLIFAVQSIINLKPLLSEFAEKYVTILLFSLHSSHLQKAQQILQKLFCSSIIATAQDP